MIAIYQFPFSWNVLLLPLMIIVLLLNSLGLGLWLSALAIQYRDVKHAMTFLVQFLMYLAPVVYPTSNIPENWRLFYAINPMVGVIEGFRSIFLNTGPIPWTYLGIGFFVSLIIFLLGIFYFKKAERHFADVA
jgi:lipopolysaccharide transport system permease protein